MSLSDVIKTALDQMQSMAKSDTVVGEPIVSGNVTLIPVSRVSIGFAAGGAGKDDKAGSGAGTGGGVSVTPIAFISIIDDRVQVHPVNKDYSLAKIMSLAPDLMHKIGKFMKRDDDKKETSGTPGGDDKKE
jgi:uncharacterized spore protein YtfJ